MNICVWIIFWIFALSECLQTNSLAIRTLRTLNSDFDAEELKKNVKCFPDSTFYTPKNVKPKCITAALDCFLKEFKGVVKHECDGPNDDIHEALEFLEIKLKEAGHVNNSKECACETQDQTPFSEFIDQIKSLLMLQKTLQNMDGS